MPRSSTFGGRRSSSPGRAGAPRLCDRRDPGVLGGYRDRDHASEPGLDGRSDSLTPRDSRGWHSSARASARPRFARICASLRALVGGDTWRRAGRAGQQRRRSPGLVVTLEGATANRRWLRDPLAHQLPRHCATHAALAAAPPKDRRQDRGCARGQRLVEVAREGIQRRPVRTNEALQLLERIRKLEARPDPHG